MEILQKSAKEAARLFPSAAQEGSELYNRMLEIEKRLVAANDPLIIDPNKPLIIAMRADAELKAEKAFDAQVKASIAAALTKHPALRDQHSAFAQRYLALLHSLEAANDAVLDDPHYPQLLADRVAASQASVSATTSSARGIIAAGGRADLWKPRDATQDKFDDIQQQIDMQENQRKLDEFRAHQQDVADRLRHAAK